MAEGLRIRGAISNTRSFGGTGFASNSAKIREGKCPPAPSVLPALYTIEQRCGFSIHFSSTQRIRPVIFHKVFPNKEDGASLKSYSVVYLLSEQGVTVNNSFIKWKFAIRVENCSAIIKRAVRFIDRKGVDPNSMAWSLFDKNKEYNFKDLYLRDRNRASHSPLPFMIRLGLKRQVVWGVLLRRAPHFICNTYWMNEVAMMSGTVWHSKIVNRPLLT